MHNNYSMYNIKWLNYQKILGCSIHTHRIWKQVWDNCQKTCNSWGRSWKIKWKSWRCWEQVHWYWRWTQGNLQFNSLLLFHVDRVNSFYSVFQNAWYVFLFRLLVKISNLWRSVKKPQMSEKSNARNKSRYRFMFD